MTLPVPVDAKGLDWPRKIANAINALLRAFDTRTTLPFEMLDAEPADPVEGQAYYSLTDHKLKVFDGTVWQNLW